jgi:predicted nucleotidyltransferase
MILSQDFRELLQLLNENGVEYLVVGGYAVILYGHVRATGDIDLWVKATSENGRAIIAALHDFGFASLSLVETDFIEEDAIVQLGRPPYRVDFLTSIDGVIFDCCYEHRHIVQHAGISIPFIDLEDLKINKKASGRLRDLADLEALESIPEEGE